ncbi:ACBP2 [Symbiodinium sp. KB8]|nr:ACBP2 [Symbiodinium sp. KB8]
MAELSYGPSVLLFTAKTKSHSLQKFAPPKSQWKDFQKMCAPDAKWVTMDSTGDLKLASAPETGAVDSVKDLYKGQTATVCHVSAMLRKSPTADWEKKSVDFILVKPSPAKKLSYSTSLIASSISQVVPPVLPVPFKEGEMPPNAYTMRCDKAGFTFDSLHGIGFYNGHPLLELQPNGQLSLNIGPSFVHIFDSMGSSKHNKKIGLLDLKLKCRIFGSFGDQELAPISARMDIAVSDSTCWVEEKIPCRKTHRWTHVTSHAQCQHTCRNTASCSHYKYWRHGRTAYCYDTKLDETKTSTCTVWSKVPDCNPMSTCVKVDAPTWLERGIYCPVGYDIDRQSMTYLKDGKTPKERIYLRRYKAGVDQTVDGCTNGGWLLQEKDANDFMSLSKGIFEFSGPLVGCQVKGVSYTGLPCEQPGNITEEGADMQPIILDDPNTKDPADFWLHPCAALAAIAGLCKQGELSQLTSVSGAFPGSEVFAQMPPESADDFVPSPMMIVEGQFVCPPGYMLGDGPIFESDIESMEIGDCEIKCKNNDDCHFFWHGSQHSANTCRLYSRCDNLLREPGVEGVLKAVPRSPICLVNNPEMCWTKTMRRYALTSEKPPSEFQFLYWNLHAQCDYMLLLGGWGVSGCARPSHRTLKSHRWAHKKLLPEEFAHGTRLKAATPCNQQVDWCSSLRILTSLSLPLSLSLSLCVRSLQRPSCSSLLGLGLVQCSLRDRCWACSDSGLDPAQYHKKAAAETIRFQWTPQGHMLERAVQGHPPGDPRQRGHTDSRVFRASLAVVAVCCAVIALLRKLIGLLQGPRKIRSSICRFDEKHLFTGMFQSSGTCRFSSERCQGLSSSFCEGSSGTLPLIVVDVRHSRKQ